MNLCWNWGCQTSGLEDASSLRHFSNGRECLADSSAKKGAAHLPTEAARWGFLMVYKDKSFRQWIKESPSSCGDGAQHCHDVVRAQHHCPHVLMCGSCHHREWALREPLDPLLKCRDCCMENTEGVSEHPLHLPSSWAHRSSQGVRSASPQWGCIQWW